MKAQILEELKSLRAFSECHRQALAETDLKMDQILVCIPPLSISVEVQCALDERHPDSDKWKMEVPQDSRFDFSDAEMFLEVRSNFFW